VPSSACLSEDHVAALVEGRLTGDALAQVERHLVTCGECRVLVSSTADVVGSTPSRHEEPAASVRGTETSPILRKNERVARYVIQALVGGMGRVYAAYDPSLDRRVALKLLRPDVAVSPRVMDRDHVRVGDPGHRLRLAQEARLPIRHGDVRPKELERHAPIERRVVRRIDAPHPARADQGLDDVAGYSLVFA
jgi:hypothetical protein